MKLVDANDRYNFTVGKHYHIVCEKCGAVADVEYEIDDSLISKNAHGCEEFLVKECHVEFHGICAKCQTEQN